MLKKILLVDDDKLHLFSVFELLRGKYEISIAKSGKSALNLIERGYVPNLIFLDVLMPNMDGWETFIRLKSIKSIEKVPIVFFTGINDDVEKKHAEELGAADYITKPYNEKELLEKIEKILMG